MTEKEIIKPLMRYVQTGMKDSLAVWGDWLEWICRGLEFKKVQASGAYPARLYEMKCDNPDYFEAMESWVEYATENLGTTKGAFDAFGNLYESWFQSKYKASNTGQFFTPMPLCNVMAEICHNNLAVPTDEVIVCSDEACGSGRTLMAAWGKADKSNRILFKAGDIDTTSVNMCALNFLVAGMVGCVQKMDALSQTWSGAYIVNSCHVPYYCEYPSLEWFDDREDFTRHWDALKRLAGEWDVIKYRQTR